MENEKELTEKKRSWEKLYNNEYYSNEQFSLENKIDETYPKIDNEAESLTNIQESEDVPVKQTSAEQRDALPGEPTCIICGKFGEYVCDSTEKDVCSLECKYEHLQRENGKQEENSQTFQYDYNSYYQQYYQQQIENNNPTTNTTDYIEDDDVKNLSESQVASQRQQYQIRVSGKEISKPISSFSQIHLSPDKIEYEKLLHQNLQNYKYLNPTPIQMQTIPICLSKRDVLASAPTSSGKSAAFIIPSIVHVLNMYSVVPEGKPIVLILSPTRELSMQLEDKTKEIGKGMGLRTALIVGGNPVPNQIYRLNQGVQIIVATPGRLNDIIDKESVDLSFVSILILDEVDVMLELGFEKQVSKIVELLPKEHCTWLFSATIPQSVEIVCRKITKDSIYISVGNPNTASTSVEQLVMWVGENSKKKRLFELLQDPGYYRTPMVIFVESKMGAEFLADAITKTCKVEAKAMHGDKNQKERSEILQQFINGEFPIIVSTGLLGRGLDLLNVTQVINFDLPPTVDQYIHQIGRAGRLRSQGYSISFVNNENKKQFADYYRLWKNAKVSMPAKFLYSEGMKQAAQKYAFENKKQKT